jgi:DNA-binding MarR family transcriptional regulator
MKEQKLMEIILSLKKKCSDREEGIRKRLNLSSAEFNALSCLRGKEKITCQDFSQRMGLSYSRGSRVIEKLVQQRFIGRADCSEDRRCKFVWLTEEGRKTSQIIKTENKNCEKKISSFFSKNRLQTLKNELNILVENL